MPGRRLVYSVGILWLAATAGLLLTVFSGITDRLIPLFAVGAFMAFTLSQLGMSVHWLRRKGNGIRLLINGTGTAGTGGALVVILAAKFIEGAWIVVLVIPCVLALLKTIYRYYEMIEAEHPGRPVLVVIPEVVKEHWWDYLLLDSSRIRRLRAALLAVVTVPRAREEPHPEEVIAEEEPQSQEPATAEPQPV
jgi:hypothetical protein